MSEFNWNAKRWKKSGSVVQEHFYSEKIVRLVKVLNSIKKIHGLVDIDAKMDNKGNIFLLEFNTRPSGTVYGAELMGIPVFSFLENVLTGKKIKRVQFKNSKKVNL